MLSALVRQKINIAEAPVAWWDPATKDYAGTSVERGALWQN